MKFIGDKTTHDKKGVTPCYLLEVVSAKHLEIEKKIQSFKTLYYGIKNTFLQKKHCAYF